MRTYDRILAPVDFSPLSKIAAEEAVVVSERHQCELIFLHVIESSPEHLTHFRLEDMSPEHFIIEQVKKDLIALCEQLRRPDATREVRLTSRSAKKPRS